jgi:multiple sugar transport system permease protein
VERDVRYEDRTALLFVLPFVIVYAVLFLYPTAQMVAMSLTDAQLTIPGKWIGIANYIKLFNDWRMGRAIVNTATFVLWSVLPGTILGLLIAMMVARLRGIWQSVVLGIFFLPYVLPVTTIANIWYAALDPGAPLQVATGLITGDTVNIFKKKGLALPAIAAVTVWWTVGFNVLLFLAGLRNIPPEIYEAATLDKAGRWRQFASVTWPLVWPVTALVLTIQLILQIKVFDQVYLLTSGDASLVLVQHIYNLAFQKDRGGYASAVAVALFVLVMIVSVLQYQALRARGEK